MPVTDKCLNWQTWRVILPACKTLIKTN